MKRKKLMSVVVALCMLLSLLLGTVTVHAEEPTIEEKIDEIVASMTVEQKIGQKIMSHFRYWDSTPRNTNLYDYNQEVGDVIKDYHLGGVILFGQNIDSTATAAGRVARLLYGMQMAALDSETGIPLFTAVDQEGGSITRLTTGASQPGNMALGATRNPQLAYQSGQMLGKEVKAMGFNINFAPTLDVNNNPLNPVINLRSFSDDPYLVAEMGVAMVQGIQSQGVAASAKHFPGHGDTDTDSHYGLPMVDKPMEELEKMELVPFQAAMDNGIDMVMTTHIVFPAVDEDLPATLSRKVMTGLIRDKMGYEGVTVTDAMEMDAISGNFGQEEAVVLTFAAGVDIALMPATVRCVEERSRFDAIFAAVKEAIAEGRISMEEMDESVKRILRLKYKNGIMDEITKELDPEELAANANAVVGCEEHRQLERELAARCATVVVNKNRALPFRPAADEKVLFLGAYANEVTLFNFAMQRLAAEGKVDYEYEGLRFSSSTTLESIKQALDSADYIIVISEIGASTNLSPASWLTRIPQEVTAYAAEQGIPSAVISLLRPYDVGNYPDADAVVAVYNAKGLSGTVEEPFTYGPNLPAGVEVILGYETGKGVLPVSVPTVDLSKEGNMDVDNMQFLNGFGFVDKTGETNRTLLQNTIELAEEIMAGEAFKNAPVEKKQAFTAAWEEAKAALADVYAGQPDLDETAAVLGALAFQFGVDSALELLVDEVKDYKAADYTASSWGPFVLALADAETYLAGGTGDAQEYYTALMAAANGLEPLGHAETLQLFVDLYKTMIPANYTPASWAAMAVALDNGGSLLADPANLAARQVEEALTALHQAARGLVLAVSAGPLEQAMTAARELLADADSFIPASVTNLRNKLAAAEALLQKEGYTAQEMLAATLELVEAMSVMFEKGGKAPLQLLISSANRLDEADYTPASWAAFKNALENGQKALDDPNALQRELDEAYTALSNAIRGLAVRANKSGLITAIAVADGILANSSQYVPSTIEGLQAQRDQAALVRDDGGATQQQTNEAQQALMQAVLAARKPANKDVLKRAFGRAAAVEGLFAQAELETAAANAARVLAEENATAYDVQQALDGLTQAMTDFATPAKTAAALETAPVQAAGTPDALIRDTTTEAKENADAVLPAEQVAVADEAIAPQPQQAAGATEQRPVEAAPTPPQTLAQQESPSINVWTFVLAATLALCGLVGLWVFAKKKRNEK